MEPLFRFMSEIDTTFLRQQVMAVLFCFVDCVIFPHNNSVNFWKLLVILQKNHLAIATSSN